MGKRTHFYFDDRVSSVLRSFCGSTVGIRGEFEVTTKPNCKHCLSKLKNNPRTVAIEGVVPK